MSFFDHQGAKLGSRLSPNSADSKCLAVFSHPNHEIAVIETLKRVDAHVCFLTDGGGPRRIAESERGLRATGLLDKAVFLGWPEAAFYEALLRRDAGFFRTVARSVRVVAQLYEPEHILCDAVEYYNPVHDMTLPIVRWAALDQELVICGVPLVFEPEGRPGEAVLQSAPEGRDRVVLKLDHEESEEKLALFRDTYTILHAAFGPLVGPDAPALSYETVLTETARGPRPAGYGFRYERRARELLKEGKVAEAILYAPHYVETVDRLEANPE